MAQRISRLFLIILLGLSISGRAQNYKRTVITDPNVSRRCEILLEGRKEKMGQKQRILALIERNKHLQKITPENKITLKEKLERNLGHLNHELTLILLRIQSQEETIVRKGCPGITL